MRILVVGNGGREHALAWKLAQSPRCERLYATRPNAGLSRLAEAVDVAPGDVEAVVGFALREDIGLVVVGPEQPLVAGLVDALAAVGVRAFGPSRAAARLEGSKAHAKEVMDRAGVPTAGHGVFEAVQPALEWVRQLGGAAVVKADGLAAGKGVVLCHSEGEAEAALRGMLGEGRFGAAGERVVVEELLEGEEVSFIALCDGAHVLPLASSQDHKRLGDGDVGPNTGGMGAYSPAPILTEALAERVMREVMLPTVRTLAEAGTPFVGFLYAGLMLTAAGPRVLEFNVRMGDPEAQPLMMRLDADLVELLEAALDGRLDEVPCGWHAGAATCVVMAAAGYPSSPRKGDPIVGLDAAARVAGTEVFHAATREARGEVVTAGGRVLGVTARGRDIAEATARAYEAVDHIRWPGMQHRRDIGWRALMAP